MRIVVLTNEHHPAGNYILTKILQWKRANIVGIVCEDSVEYSKLYKHIKRGYHRFGILLGLRVLFVFIGLKIIGTFLRLFSSKRRIFQPDELAAKHNKPFIVTKDINSPETLQQIRNLKPDLIISNCFSQIIKQELLDIPTITSINIHPGLIPQYKGLFPYFWAIFHKEKRAGVTIHEISEEVDGGAIIGQKVVRISKKDCVVGLSIKNGKAGFKLLKRILPQIEKDYKKLIKHQKRQKNGFYTFPSRQQLNAFFKRGKELVSWRRFIREH